LASYQAEVPREASSKNTRYGTIMPGVTRIELFERAARKLRASFEELANIPHRGEKGGQAEDIVRRFLNDHLPRRFAAAGGFILDQRDQLSKQTDVIVYDAFNCPVYRADEEAGIFPNDNVAAVIEVKSRLDADRLAEAVENIAAAKRLSKLRGKEDGAEQWATLGCLFAFESALALDTVCTKYRELLAGRTFGLHIDLILVLDRGLVTLVACGPGASTWTKMMAPTGTGGAAGEGFHIGIAGAELGDRSLDAFLRVLVAHLSLFRHAVGHPGFDWAAMGAAGTTRLHYLTTLTEERDPTVRAAKLREYAEDFKKRFPSGGADR
jgi:hypothetical protein